MGVNNSSPKIATQFPTKEKNIDQSIRKLENLANKGIAGNPVKMDGIKKTDLPKVKEKIVYYDTKDNSIVMRNGMKLYRFAGTEITE